MNFINQTNSIRRLATVLLLAIIALPLFSQEKEDSVLTFRFLSKRDMFFVPLMTNGEELTRLFSFVDQYKDKISGGDMPIYVDGYCISRPTEAANLAMAKIRSNRVKSELITRKGLTENCFITHNHAEQGDFVTVRIVALKKELQSPEEVVPADSAVAEVPTPPVVEPEIVEVVEPADSVDIPVDVEPIAVEVPEPEHSRKWGDHFALKTNLLGYAVLMPNVELEWMFTNRWSAALEFQGAWYAKENPHKVYRLSTLTPEVRYWAIERSRWHGMYVGMFGGIGMFDLCNGNRGHEGEGFMVGASVGYMWPITKHLSLDAGIGVGYLRAKDKEYVPFDGHFLYQLTKNINYVGPLRLKLSLVWRFQSY